jgi:Skp family chaperone for outer membrane proteins
MSMYALKAVAAAAVVAAGILAGPSSARAELKVGAVDIIEVMNGYERTKDASADLQVEQNRLKTDAEVKKKRLDELWLKRDAFNKGSDEYKKLDDDALQVEMEVRTWLAVEQAKIERKHMEVMLEMYGQIQKTVARVAKDKAVDVVFTKSFLEPPQIDTSAATGLEDLKTRIVGQRVLYPASATDLTKDVIKTLNEDYAAAKKKAPGGPAKLPAEKPVGGIDKPATPAKTPAEKPVVPAKTPAEKPATPDEKAPVPADEPKKPKG